MQGTAAVVGVGESAYYVRGRSPDSEFQLACTAIRRAVEDSGLSLAEIDGFATYMDQRNDPLRLARALGVRELRWTSQPYGGGGNNVAAAVSPMRRSPGPQRADPLAPGPGSGPR